MQDTQAQTESLINIIDSIKNQTIMLPEFQRDFRWEMERTYDLFDSLIQEIFIGTIIYGKPSFGMTLRDFDDRPRKGQGSRKKLGTTHLSTSDITRKAQTQNFRIVLDGQQRITSLYRAITGIDNVYFILREIGEDEEIGKLSLEALLERFAGDENTNAISVKLSDAYLAETGVWEDEEQNERFEQSKYAKALLKKDVPQEQYKRVQRLYRRTMRLLIDFYKQQKMVAFYLLDMNLDKFCLFFERSNSRGIQLNFTDILAAKLYSGFNLRKKIEDFEDQTKLNLNREIIVRAIAYTRGREKNNIQIDKAYILKNLNADDFEEHWDNICTLYAKTLHYLAEQNYILSQDWMPTENMVIPLMMFLREIGGSFDRISEPQRRFIEFWYWATIFANRYSTSTNETIIVDSTALIQIANGQRISQRGYFTRLRSLITGPEDLFSYTKRASSTYRGVLNLLSYATGGLYDWKNTNKIDISMRLEDHHIYPAGYISSTHQLDMDQSEAEQLVDCVVNRTLIPKLLNINLGKRSPYTYLSELKAKYNPQLEKSLTSHLVPTEILKDQIWDTYFWLFLQERSKNIFSLIERYAIQPAAEMAQAYGTEVELHD